jgi:hypothetical protein
LESASRKEFAIISSQHTMHENNALWANTKIWAAKLLNRLIFNVAKTVKKYVMWAGLIGSVIQDS